MTFTQIILTLPPHILDKLKELKTMRERPDFHPEPSAFHHIEIVTNRCIEFGDKDLICAGIFHDIHKLDTMKINPKSGHPTSPGHDKWARKTVQTDELVRNWIINFGADPDTVAGLCGQHMRMHQLSQMKPTKQKIMMDLPFFDKLTVFSTFDNMLITDEEAQIAAQAALEAANTATDQLPDTLKGKFSDNSRK